MKCVLDTHFLIWIVTDAPRLKQFPWLQRYASWGVSPVSFLEVQLLAESGRLKLRPAAFIEAIKADPRFMVDDIATSVLFQKALELGWTRDPFDRLLAAHSLARRTPLCTTDSDIQKHHALIVSELR
jgi:PIN domain nuclease of toxin-antitoxin system